MYINLAILSSIMPNNAAVQIPFDISRCRWYLASVPSVATRCKRPGVSIALLVRYVLGWRWYLIIKGFPHDLAGSVSINSKGSDHCF